MLNFIKAQIKKRIYMLNPRPKINIGPYVLRLPRGHSLPLLKKNFPLYDEFICALSKNIENGIAIDIGANVGDTALLIAQGNPKMEILAVEPDQDFFCFLKNNVKNNCLQTQIKMIRSFISNQKGKFTTKKAHGTAYMVKNELADNAISSISISELIKNHVHNENEIRFIKSDTDGYDYQILNSIYEYLTTSSIRPIIFYEHQTFPNESLDTHLFDDKDISSRIEQYENSIKNLVNLGYNNFTILDNYGTPMFVNSTYKNLFEFGKWIYNSQVRNKPGSVYYVDVAICTDKDSSIIQNSCEMLTHKEV